MTPRALVPACRLTVTVLNRSRWKHTPLYVEILTRAKRYGLRNATVLRAVEGFGADGVVGTARVLGLGDRAPLMLVMTDEEPRISGFLDELDPLMEIESMVVERVHQVVVSVPGAGQQMQERA
ncbi:hypothetical protein GCM10018793_24140 [Streptomyces sulfonofaciens]|uniref:DUF190 domain-containing protein n=1 Tax=Streptomyces sulfonofaciens TaxID=68272 RepID=A0A919KZ36_9ACTN|nr:DUF190 domain-containing protein [Streptomyces sulfonofaciens]GHH76976.1 hypothetical protein GCM10018793_24140 [Streptomyces sulfonofaciens]